MSNGMQMYSNNRIAPVGTVDNIQYFLKFKLWGWDNIWSLDIVVDEPSTE